MANCSVKLEFADSYVSSTHADSFEVEYGSKIYVSDNVLLIGDESIVFTLADADAQYEYVLHLEVNNASIVSGSTLTGAMTVMVSAERVERTYTVSIGTNNSSYGSVSSTTIANVAYGSTIEIEGNKIVIKKGGTTVATITATAKSGYEFDKWIGVVGHVNGNISITASFA